jgi:hypothetical protein
MRGALVRRPSICEHPPKSGARARFYCGVDLVNRLERAVTGGRLLPGTSTGQRSPPGGAASQPRACQAVTKGDCPLGRRQVHQVFPGARTTEPRADTSPTDGTTPEQEFANRSANLANRSHNTSDEKFEKCLLY